MNINKSDSDDEKHNFQRYIHRLNRIKEKIGAEDRKLASVFRTELNSLMKTRPISTEADSKRLALKRKVISSQNTGDQSYKRKRVDQDEFPFTTLPGLLQDSIMEKFDYRSFATFDQCCEFSHSMCENTNKQFTFKNTFVELEDALWKFRPMCGVRRNIVATTEQLKNVKLEVFGLDVKTTVNDELALFFIAQLKAETVSFDEGFSCSQELLDLLMQTIGVRDFTVNLNDAASRYQWDVRNIESFSFQCASELTSDMIRKIKPIKEFTISRTGDMFMLRNLGEKINSMIEDGDENTMQFVCFYNREEVSGILNGLGAELVEGTTNCYVIKKENSKIPRLFVALTSLSLIICNSVEFYKCFETLAEYP